MKALVLCEGSSILCVTFERGVMQVHSNIEKGPDSPLKGTGTTTESNSHREEELTRIFSNPGEVFHSLEAMRAWLDAKGVNLVSADSAKGLNKLFNKIRIGEAKLVYDELTNQVYRCATVSKISTEVTIHEERYPLFELCQIFLEEPIDPSCLGVTNPAEVVKILSSIEIRSAHVRDSQELWETFIGDEDPLLATRRGVQEELKLSASDAHKVKIAMLGSGIEYEPPIDWPGIPSILHIFEAYALLPEEISKPVFVELEKGDQLTIFVATPNSDVMRGIMKLIIPRMKIIS